MFLRSFVLLSLAAGLAVADDIEPFDADGDGDIDNDDRAILEHAEEVRIIDKSEGQKLRESARAVTVIDTKVAKERTADMGEVLSRAQGIQIRRSGGLGSASRISLNGLYDESIRTFIDGVPAELAGFGGGIENVPVGLVNRVDVHRGVVPISLGADALGGAIDLVSDAAWVNSAAVSYQTGSFGTHRATGIARTYDPSTGAALAISAFFDRTDNDYLVDVEIADKQGKITEVRVPRFHDGYQNNGVNAEVGLVKRGMIKRALLRLYYTQSDTELQHNAVMTVPYGEATSGEVTRGGVLNTLLERDGWRAHIVLGGVRRWIDFNDRAHVVYDWLGQPVRDRTMYGEIGLEAFVRTVANSGFGRFTIERALGSSQVLRFSTAPTINKRRGTDFLHDPALGRDPASARQDLTQVVSGVEHELRAFDEDRLENIAFAKHYLSKMEAEDAQWMAPFVPKQHLIQTAGIGDMLRYRLSPQLIGKASYEWSTRLPTADEVFGNGALLHPGYDLRPERSHNVNVGGRLQTDQLQLDVNAFARRTKDMIRLLNGQTYSYYENVYAARILGVEVGGTWVAPSEWASLEGAVTVQDIRNVSTEGTFAAYYGDPIPNRPWLLASLGGTIQQRELLRDDDEISLFANSRYVNGFFRGWESVGTLASKQRIAAQLVHSAGVTYALRNKTPIVTTFEVSNLLDAKVSDNYGIQKPGRAFFLRLSAEM